MYTPRQAHNFALKRESNLKFWFRKRGLKSSDQQVNQTFKILCALITRSWDSGKLILQSNWAHNTHDFLPSWALCQFFPKLPSCIIFIGSQNTMTLMQQPQYLSAVFYSYTWYRAFQIFEPWEIRSMCCTVLFFLYTNISDSRSSKKALIALEGHQDKEAPAATHWGSNELHWWAAINYKWYPVFLWKPWYCLCNVLSEHGYKHELGLEITVSSCAQGREVTSDLSNARADSVNLGNLRWYYTAVICMVLYSSSEQIL